MAKLNSSEKKIIQEIAVWKAEEPGLISKATDVMSKPLVWASNKLIPDEIKNKMSTVTETIVEKLQDASQWLVSEEDVLKATREFEIDTETILELRKASVHDLDHVGESFTKSNSQIAAAEGFGTGLIGWPGLIADLPALFALAFRLVYQISLTYGYKVDLEDSESEQRDYEVEYMLRVFRVATAPNKVEKTKGLMALKDFETQHEDDVYNDVGSDYTIGHISKNVAINVSREIINMIVSQTLARKAITAIPGIGAVLTAGFNYAYINDVGTASMMLYRERFLLDKKGRKKVINIEIE